MKSFRYLVVCLIVFVFTGPLLSQSVSIGPRVTGNFNIFNATNLTGSYNGFGIGVGPTVDVSFNKNIGMLANLIVFDMRNFSNTTSGTIVLPNGLTYNGTQTISASLAYLVIEPLFKAEFSGFYMAAGPSLGIKLSSSGEQTDTPTNQTPTINPLNPNTKTVRFDIAVGTGYTFRLSEDMFLGSDFMVNIPITNTYEPRPGTSNSIFTMKFGVSLKFKL